MGNASNNIEGIEKKNIQEERTNYPNLSEDRRKYLTALIEKLELSNSNDLSEKNLPPAEKSRKTFRNNISYALVICYYRLSFNLN